ncbi:MAG: GNAT family N-acetyltransferase [Candidatus Tumulicola sp.]
MRQLGYDAAASDLARRIERRGDDRAVFVAEDESGTLGWAAVSVEEGFVEGRQAWIEGFVVDQDSRGRGIGGHLLEVAEAWARELGCGTMRVQSNVLRERAHGFYERHGYAKIKAQFAFRKPL